MTQKVSFDSTPTLDTCVTFSPPNLRSTPSLTLFAKHRNWRIVPNRPTVFNRTPLRQIYRQFARCKGDWKAFRLTLTSSDPSFFRDVAGKIEYSHIAKRHQQWPSPWIPSGNGNNSSSIAPLTSPHLPHHRHTYTVRRCLRIVESGCSSSLHSLNAFVHSASLPVTFGGRYARFLRWINLRHHPDTLRIRRLVGYRRKRVQSTSRWALIVYFSPFSWWNVTQFANIHARRPKQSG